MELLQITGGIPLFGTVTASGAKNAALPIVAASLLVDGPVCVEGVPEVGEPSCSGLTRETFRATLAEAGNMRLMPILMTTLTTVGGLLPLMLGQGPLFKGLATVIVVGLSLGTIMTLFVLPALIAVMVEFFGVNLAGDAKSED